MEKSNNKANNQKSTVVFKICLNSWVYIFYKDIKLYIV